VNRARPSPPPSRIDAVSRGVPAVIERVSDALKMCRVPGEETGSILFGAEKERVAARFKRGGRSTACVPQGIPFATTIVAVSRRLRWLKA
jgi:hypothetical protein